MVYRLMQDTGRGFALAQPTSGHGLSGMRFRATSSGGQLTVASAPGQGATMRARLPQQI